MATDLLTNTGLQADINKVKDAVDLETTEGVVSDKLPELELKMKDEELVKITEKWEKIWTDSPKKQTWEKQGDENGNYWLGIQTDLPKGAKDRPSVDNILFEAVETYLPQVTRRNPEPLVTLDYREKDGENEDPIKTKYVDKVKGRLADIADKIKLRLQLKTAARHWGIFLLGVAKFGWDLDRDMPISQIVRPKKLILDPDATITPAGYTGNRIGEYRKMEAETIKAIIGNDKKSAKAIKAIDDLVKKDNATEIQFIEWWTPEYMCWKLGKTILLKRKNPHWNYDKTENPLPTDLSSRGVSVDAYGTATAQPVEIKGINHFPTPQMPYAFLSVFQLGDRPMDATSLIGQNLSNQDLINKRNKQIDDNADDMNGGMVVSLGRSGLTQPQAVGVAKALRNKGVIAIPNGSPNEAIQRYQPGGLPADVFTQLQDTRARLRDIFGIRGSSSAGLETEKTVRGKILNRGTDTDRIGGGVSEFLEQMADDMYNWYVQLLYVYDADFQFLEGGVPPKIVVSVKEGSLLPKDSLTIANQAIDLAIAGKMSTLDLYKKLEYPNPEEMAANVWLEVTAPQMLYANDPRVQQVLMMQQQAAQAQAQMQAGEREQETTGKEREAGQKFDRDINMERVKTENKRSLLSAVPQNKAP